VKQLRTRAFLLFELEIGCTMRSIGIWKRWENVFPINSVFTPGVTKQRLLLNYTWRSFTGNLRPVTD